MQNPIQKLKSWNEARTLQKQNERLVIELQKFGVSHINKMTLQEKIDLYNILCGEREFFEKSANSKYHFFGYIGDSYYELPAFFERSNVLYANSIIQPYTPGMVKYCMDRLDLDERLKFHAQFEDFKEMYWKLANSSKYKHGDWMLSLLIIKEDLDRDWLKYSKKLSKFITISQLSDIDWENFGKEIKPFLAPSYDSKPKNIGHRAGTEQNPPLTSLTFTSKTSPSVRNIYISGDTAYQSVNGSRFTPDENITKIWQTYYCYLLGKNINKLNDENVEQTEDVKQAFPHPHDSLTDEEDNFC